MRPIFNIAYIVGGSVNQYFVLTLNGLKIFINSASTKKSEYFNIFICVNDWFIC